MAEMLTRWWKDYRNISSVNRIQITHFDINPSAVDENFMWPDAEEIMHLQNRFKDTAPAHANIVDKVIEINGRTWIPPQCHEMQLTLIVIAHTASVKPFFYEH